MAAKRPVSRSRLVALTVLALLLGMLRPAFSSGLAAPGGSTRDTAASVSIAPAPPVALGATVTTDIYVKGYSGANGLGDYQVQVSFDRTKVNVMAVAGSDDAGSPFNGTPTSSLATANSTGQLSLEAFHTFVPGPKGPSFKVARVTWKGLFIGDHVLALTINRLTDSQGNDVAGAIAVNGLLKVRALPVASFTRSLNPSSGVVPCTVSFSDSSSFAESWSWNFGDGTGSSSQNPTRVYSQGGNYVVTLTIANPIGVDSTSQTVSIYAAPVASFTASPTAANPGVIIAFSDSSTGNIASWLWNFGDGATSTVQNPGKSYTSSGAYSVSLTVTNPAGANTATRTGYISIVGYRAEIAMVTGYETYAYVGARISRFFDPVTGTPVVPAAGITFDARVGYNAGGLSVQSGGVWTPFSGTAASGPGGTTISSGQPVSISQLPVELFRLYPWLTGSSNNNYVVSLETVVRVGVGEVPLDRTVSKTFRRGDASSDGEVTIVDALFIAQYLAGLRELGETADRVNPVNAATPLNDSAAAGAKITIQDALFIAQMMAGLRDDSYNLVK